MIINLITKQVYYNLNPAGSNVYVYMTHTNMWEKPYKIVEWWNNSNFKSGSSGGGALSTIGIGTNYSVGSGGGGGIFGKTGSFQQPII